MSQAEFYERIHRINAKQSDEVVGVRARALSLRPTAGMKALMGLVFLPIGFGGRVITEMAMQPGFTTSSPNYWEVASGTVGFHIALVSLMLMAVLKLGRAPRLTHAVIMTLFGYGLATGLFAAVMYGAVELPLGLL